MESCSSGSVTSQPRRRTRNAAALAERRWPRARPLSVMTRAGARRRLRAAPMGQPKVRQASKRFCARGSSLHLHERWTIDVPSVHGALTESADNVL